jgi:oligoribonuclease NrnB/cAMP/cGMP phosphodiesterase (DHH superfamily)
MPTKTVHVVSHGPTCLDGVTAAAAVARYYGDRARLEVRFASNSEIDAVLQGLRPGGDGEHELWITDISWRDPATDAHLRTLAASGVRIYWIDHHRTALERVKAGRVDVPFAGTVLSEEFAASRLTYEYLAKRLEREGHTEPRFTAFAPVVTMADDNDRWLHQVPGSRELGWVVRALGPDAYEDFLALDERVSYTPRMTAARARIGAEIKRSFAIAKASRVEHFAAGVRVVAAVCDGHPSEVADAWGREMRGAVFALYDATSLTVSLRRSPDCQVDLSKLAEALGGGGHAAAAGAELPDVRRILAEIIATRVAEHLP